MPRGKSPRSLSNLERGKGAPDAPGETIATTHRITPEQHQWLKAQAEGASYHVRQALRLYMANQSEGAQNG